MGRNSRQRHTSDPVAIADLTVVRAARRLAPGATPAEGRAQAGAVFREVRPIEQRYVAIAMSALLERVLDPALRSGWGPADVAEAVGRKVGAGHEGHLAGLLVAARARDAVRTSSAWEAELADLGAPSEFDLQTVDGLGVALRLAALLAVLPSGGEAPARGAHREVAVSGRSAAKLAQVRGLLAKAASTDFPEEAESLSAKAQEMIARYSLERLLADTHSESNDAGAATTYRRLWLDAPYLSAKSSLVQEVATANRSRAVFHQALGLCTIIGSAFDLDAVELLVTSLLVQAERAMAAHGRVADGYGRSRTRSFRQAFMLSFATHIGERLRAAAEESLDHVGDRGSLVPAIVSQEERVEASTDQMFPHLVTRTTRISNAAGWAGGRVAAELALLDGPGRIGRGGAAVSDTD